ncbi:MAG: glutamate synthase-related protein [Anaerolineales bacterium]
MKVGSVEDCPPGSVKTMTVNNVDNVMVNHEGEFYTLNNRCPHRGGQLGDGHLQGSDLICPLHGWDFDVRTGISRYNHLDSVPTYPVTVINGHTYLNKSDTPMEPKEYDMYLAKWARPFDDKEKSMNYIHYLARGKGKKLEAMGTNMPVPGFDSLLFLPGQIARLPLLDDESVSTEVVIGPRAKKPLKLRIPVYISHMSYGSLSLESKTAFALGANRFGTAICSGEGGMHPFDFITIDGRGGGTGAAPIHVKDNITVPLVYAIPRARRWLADHGHSDITLVVTGGLRTPADFAKALALGADCVAISTAAMMAIGCQQYRACHNNTCPVGIATQKSELRDRFNIQMSAKRLINFLEAAETELIDFCRMMGHREIGSLNSEDLITIDMGLAEYGDVAHAAEYRG